MRIQEKKIKYFILIHFSLSSIMFLAIMACAETYSPKRYTIEQFYQNNRITGGAFSEDENRLLVSSDESGIFNVYEIDILSGEKTQKTFSEKESFFCH